jgi:photosystem II stability/assembly factor-like uncharacterized protein
MSEQKDQIVEMLTQALEEAKQGRIRSAALITMKVDGSGGYWARINADEDNAAAINHLKFLRQDLNLRKSSKSNS